MCRRMAIENDDTLENMVWRVMRGLATRAEETGDPAAVKLFMSLVAKHEPTGAEPHNPTGIGGFSANNVQININDGPTPPNDVQAYINDVKRISVELANDEALAKLLS